MLLCACVLADQSISVGWLVFGSFWVLGCGLVGFGCLNTQIWVWASWSSGSYGVCVCPVAVFGVWDWDFGFAVLYIACGLLSGHVCGAVCWIRSGIGFGICLPGIRYSQFLLFNCVVTCGCGCTCPFIYVLGTQANNLAIL